MPSDLHACAPAVHSAIVADAERWERETAPTPMWNGGPLHEKRQVTSEGDHWVEWANCTACGSTITRRIDITLAQRA